MPKMKSHRGAAKRFKVSSKGKVIRHHSMTSHILTKKSTKRKRGLRKTTTVASHDQKRRPIREICGQAQ